MGRRLVCGVGINDADYEIYKRISFDGKDKIVWRCPYYVKWSSMIERCYSGILHNKQPTYTDCYVCDEWLYFSRFKAWMETQDWQGNVLDKDLLRPGNRVYSPETCLFITDRVNGFILEANKSRGDWPIGVTFNKPSRKFMARCWSAETGKCKTIGRFNTPSEAHAAWLAFKLEQATYLATLQTDPRVAKALVDRYKNYKNIDKAA